MTITISKVELNEMEKVERYFIWGDHNDRRKFHVVVWKTMVKPKGDGGIGIRNLNMMNKACLMKMG